MNSKSHLNKVPIVNSKGVATHVYRKDAAAENIAGKSLPMPQLSDAPTADDSQNIDELIKKLDSHLDSHYFNEYEEDIKTIVEPLHKALPLMSIRMATRVVDQLGIDNSSSNNATTASHVSTIYGDDSKVLPEHRETVLRNALAVLPDWNAYEEFLDPDSGVYAQPVFEAAGGYERTTPFSLEEKLACQCAATVVSHIMLNRSRGNLDGSGIRVDEHRNIELTDKDVIPALAESGDKMDQIFEHLIERQSLSSVVIREISAHGVLGDGVI